LHGVYFLKYASILVFFHFDLNVALALKGKLSILINQLF
jgi:hypothetical protein